MKKHPQVLEFAFGGVSTSGAVLFTNPLEVVKTRMQLQGELQARGAFQIHYRNVFHAFFKIAQYEGAHALQKGLVPAMTYQFIMNGVRLGSFQVLHDSGLFSNKDGTTTFVSSIVCGALAGAVGGFVSSPLYMMKTQLQARANSAIAVGYQNKCTCLSAGLYKVFNQYGLRGLWRGSSGIVSRLIVGSAAQLATFSQAKQYILSTNMFLPHSLMVPFVASSLTGTVMVACMTPFDVVSTRLYNQKTVGATNKGGMLYSGLFDCFRKIFVSEGVWGFYKGWAASLFRLGPHTVLTLVFWDQTRQIYIRWNTAGVS